MAEGVSIPFETSLKSYLDVAAKEALIAAHNEIGELAHRNTELVKSIEGISRIATDSRSSEGRLWAELDEAIQQKTAAQKAIEELNQQLSTQADLLQKAEQSLDQQAARVRALEAQVAQLRDRQMSAKQSLQHLRQICRA